MYVWASPSFFFLNCFVIYYYIVNYRPKKNEYKYFFFNSLNLKKKLVYKFKNIDNMSEKTPNRETDLGILNANIQEWVII
jgi:hypothetical protein